MKHIHFPLILLTIMLACNLFTACNDDEGGGIPVIHHIRLTDPEKADSTFTDVNPGTMIVAIGENLNGVKKVFINQQEVSFNSNYSTSTNLILTIPADLPLVGANPDLKDERALACTLYYPHRHYFPRRGRNTITRNRRQFLRNPAYLLHHSRR